MKHRVIAVAPANNRVIWSTEYMLDMTLSFPFRLFRRT